MKGKETVVQNKSIPSIKHMYVTQFIYVRITLEHHNTQYTNVLTQARPQHTNHQYVDGEGVLDYSILTIEMIWWRLMVYMLHIIT